MARVGRFLSWFVLAPYFASWAIPMGRTLFTNDVDLAKRWRAQNVIAFGILIIIPGVLALTGQTDLLSGVPYFWMGLLGGLSAILLGCLIGAMLDRERESRLRATYNSIPRWKRLSFVCTWWAFVGGMFAMFVWLTPTPSRTAPPWTNLHCDAAATEMTAETCSPASGRS